MISVAVFVSLVFICFVYFRWTYIDDLLEARKPNYKYIAWLEHKFELTDEQFVEEHISGARHFHGLHEYGLYGTLKVLGCSQCQMIYEQDGEISNEMVPCYKHVTWFDN